MLYNGKGLDLSLYKALLSTSPPPPLGKRLVYLCCFQFSLDSGVSEAVGNILLLTYALLAPVATNI